MSLVERDTKPAKGCQTWATPWEFIRAVEVRFGPIHADLACTRENAKAGVGLFHPDVDALAVSWADRFPDGVLFVNPPFAKIEPWAAKCAIESTRRKGLILMLTPAAIGTDWFAAHVHRKAQVIGIRPRIPFDGTPINPKTGKPDGFPKDLMLTVYGLGFSGFDTWRWRS